MQPALNGVHNLGPVAQPFLSKAFLLAELTLQGGATGNPSFQFDLIVKNTPEPSTIVLVGLGLLWLGCYGWRRRKWK